MRGRLKVRALLLLLFGDKSSLLRASGSRRTGRQHVEEATACDGIDLGVRVIRQQRRNEQPVDVILVVVESVNGVNENVVVIVVKNTGTGIMKR